MKKTYLLSPGPTPLPDKVVSTFAQPVPHHRTPQFSALFEEVQKNLKYIFQTQQDVLMLAATGTGAMDAAVSNLFRKGEKVLTINGGKFGDRWTKIASRYGLQPIEIQLVRGQPVTIEQIESEYKKNPDIQAVLFQASETSTGVMMPTKEITEFCQKNNLISVVDAVTAAGVFDLPMDQWGIDVMVTGSQKALMIPPGMAFIALSDRAWAKVETGDLPYFYFDLQKERKSQAKAQTAWTPAISLIQGLQVSLDLIRQEGLENTFKRHDLLARATRAGIKALGLELLCKDAPSTAVTAVLVPDGVDGKAIPKLMRDHYGVTIAGGQDELTGKIFRLSHFGFVGKFDVTTGLSCLELALSQLGYKVQFGTSVGAALEVFSKE